jgi:hypothetical protein
MRATAFLALVVFLASAWAIWAHTHEAEDEGACEREEDRCPACLVYWHHETARPNLDPPESRWAEPRRDRARNPQIDDPNPASRGPPAP